MHMESSASSMSPGGDRPYAAPASSICSEPLGRISPLVVVSDSPLGLPPDLEQLQTEQPRPGQDPEQRGLVRQPATQDRSRRDDGHVQLFPQYGHDRVAGRASESQCISGRPNGLLPPSARRIPL